MAREIVFQYNGRESHRESPILDRDDSFTIPSEDEIIARRGTHYRVRSVKHFPEIAGLASRCIVDIAPIYPLPSGD
jgi:hypothetical protein